MSDASFSELRVVCPCDGGSDFTLKLATAGGRVRVYDVLGQGASRVENYFTDDDGPVDVPDPLDWRDGADPTFGAHVRWRFECGSCHRPLVARDEKLARAVQLLHTTARRSEVTVEELQAVLTDPRVR